MGKGKSSAVTEDFLTLFKFIRTKRQEYLVCLSLDSAGKPLRRRTVTIGTLNATLVHPREVFAGPLQDRAAAVVIAHNHPSGDPEPSKDDIKTTQQLVAAGQLLDIKLVDHVIVTRHDHYSFRRGGLL